MPIRVQGKCIEIKTRQTAGLRIGKQLGGAGVGVKDGIVIIASGRELESCRVEPWHLQTTFNPRLPYQQKLPRHQLYAIFKMFYDPGFRSYSKLKTAFHGSKYSNS